MIVTEYIMSNELVFQKKQIDFNKWVNNNNLNPIKQILMIYIVYVLNDGDYMNHQIAMFQLDLIITDQPHTICLLLPDI